MNYKLLGKLFGFVLLIEAALLLLPLLVCVIYREPVLPFLYSIAILLAVSVPLVMARPTNKRIYAKEGFVCVAGSWILLSLFGALPFVFSGAIPNYIDALFETISGFTTTGATLLTELEGLPYGILFWRSFTHWIGGMGILVFMLALLPSLGGNAIHIMRAEVPGPKKDKLVPKAKQTALILYGIYILLTFFEIIALLIAKMPLYDAVVNSFATAGTGGFSVKNASIAAYDNPTAEWIIASFMLIFGINFNIYFYVIIKKFRLIFKNEELRAYLIIIVLSTALITLNTWNSVSVQFEGVADCIRASFFHVCSIISTTGFATVNYDLLWPNFSKMIILFLTVMGASAGSTSGGLKISRLIILLKTVGINIKRTLKPNSINTLSIDGKPITEQSQRSVTTYFAIYTLLIMFFTLIVAIDGKDFTTTLTATITCINNVGPGLSAVGPAGNFSAFSPLSKITLSLAMLFGRLELLPMLIFLSPATWFGSFKRHRAKG